MAYQVLARKWRPKTFADLVGQEHVVKALRNALDEGRLHHAYLLTGTRGVGKTTIARILAKSLNCVNANHGEPCGVCQSCTQIDAGRYVDLLEIDAASNTGIDNIREVLENAQYAPTAGKYKVYIIDEVHMLSKSAFNAMLKTLEEPPEHVKFILATTDPHKVPITVLSRCLQFVLRNMTTQQVADHLAHVLTVEQVPFEPPALQLLGRAAAGSMRDALSLLDQAIAMGSGSVTEHDVRQMIGAVDKRYLYELLQGIVNQDGEELLHKAQEMAARAIGFDNALSELAMLLQKLALTKTVPSAVADDPERDTLLRLAQYLSGEQIQLYYQCAVHGKQDLNLAPDEYAGFVMTLLRMLAFAPIAAKAHDPEGVIEGTQLHNPEAEEAAAKKPLSLPEPPSAAQSIEQAAPESAVNNVQTAYQETRPSEYTGTHTAVQAAGETVQNHAQTAPESAVNTFQTAYQATRSSEHTEAHTAVQAAGETVQNHAQTAPESAANTFQTAYQDTRPSENMETQTAVQAASAAKQSESAHTQAETPPWEDAPQTPVAAANGSQTAAEPLRPSEKTETQAAVSAETASPQNGVHETSAAVPEHFQTASTPAAEPSETAGGQAAVQEQTAPETQQSTPPAAAAMPSENTAGIQAGSFLNSVHSPQTPPPEHTETEFQTAYQATRLSENTEAHTAVQAAGETVQNHAQTAPESAVNTFQTAYQTTRPSENTAAQTTVQAAEPARTQAENTPPWEDTPQTPIAATDDFQTAPDYPPEYPAPPFDTGTPYFPEEDGSPDYQAYAATMPSENPIDSDDGEQADTEADIEETGFAPLPEFAPENWAAIVKRLAPKLGAAQMPAQHAAWTSYQAETGLMMLSLTEEARATTSKERLDKIQNTLAAAYGLTLKLQTEPWREDAGWETPAMRRTRLQREGRQKAQQLLEADPAAQQMLELFEAEWLPDTLELAEFQD